MLKTEDSCDYRDMPLAATAQWTVKNVVSTWYAYWAALRAYNEDETLFTAMPEMPRYKHKTKGRAVVFLTNQNVKLKDGMLQFPRSFQGFAIPFDENGKIMQVRIVPRNRHFVIEVVYLVSDVTQLTDNNHYISVDLGIDNFATVVSNDGSQPVLINGKNLKSINKYWNKRLAHLKSVNFQMNGFEIQTKKGETKRVANQTPLQVSITNKRNNQVKDFCHKASKMIVDLAIERRCNTIIVGKNTGWKQSVNIGKINNQTFTQLPHAKFINILSYKAECAGLIFLCTEESYTSKTSWLDDEIPEKHNKYAGRRIKRGLFKASSGELINADVNGALQIARKVFPNAKAEGIWAYGRPLRVDVS